MLNSFTHYDFTCFSYFSCASLPSALCLPSIIEKVRTAFHPTAVFPAVLLVTRLLKNGSRCTLQYDRKMEAEGKKGALPPLVVIRRSLTSSRSRTARYFVREVRSHSSYISSEIS